MTLLDAKEGEEYIVKEISTDDEELEAFLFSLGVLQRGADHGSFSFKRRLCGFHQRRQI